MGEAADELRQEIEVQREQVGRDLDALGDRVSPGRIVERRTEAVTSRLRSVRERVMGAPDDGEDGEPGMTDRVSGTAHRAADLASTAAGGVGAVPDRVRSTTQGNPLAVGLVAFGAGLVAASLLPPTQRERRLAERAQPALEQLGTRVGEAGRGVAEDLRPAVSDAVEAVEGDAADAVHRVRDQATGAT